MFDHATRKMILNKFDISNEVFDDVPISLINIKQPRFNLKDDEGVEKTIQARYESK